MGLGGAKGKTIGCCDLLSVPDVMLVEPEGTPNTEPPNTGPPNTDPPNIFVDGLVVEPDPNTEPDELPNTDRTVLAEDPNVPM